MKGDLCSPQVLGRGTKSTVGAVPRLLQKWWRDLKRIQQRNNHRTPCCCCEEKAGKELCSVTKYKSI